MRTESNSYPLSPPKAKKEASVASCLEGGREEGAWQTSRAGPIQDFAISGEPENVPHQQNYSLQNTWKSHSPEGWWQTRMLPGSGWGQCWGAVGQRQKEGWGLGPVCPATTSAALWRPLQGSPSLRARGAPGSHQAAWGINSLGLLYPSAEGEQ